jgi:hypothetical protein
MLEPLGYIGFFSKRHIYDLAGLVTPEFASTRQKQVPRRMFERIQQLRPDYLVLRQYELANNQFFASGNAPLFYQESDRAWWEENYRTEKQFGTDMWAMIIYRRADIVSECD